jgi:hypothetical protein
MTIAQLQGEQVGIGTMRCCNQQSPMLQVLMQLTCGFHETTAILILFLLG